MHRDVFEPRKKKQRKKSVNEWTLTAKTLISHCILIPEKKARPIYAFSHRLHFEVHKRIWLQHICGEAVAVQLDCTCLLLIICPACALACIFSGYPVISSVKSVVSD